MASVEALARDLYRLHGARVDYSHQLKELAALVGKEVTKSDVDAAFGSVDPETFAAGLFTSRVAIPTDLSFEEMLEVVESIYTGKAPESLASYWIRCLEANTGDAGISDLIFWPGEYFGDGNNRRRMSPREILETAIAAGRKAK